MVSVAILPGDETHPGDGVLRTVQGVLSGIGFLGAGVIMRAAGKEEIHGLTTASLIWIASILGLICGLGQWVLGLSTFGLAGCILIGGRWIELKVSQIAITPPAGSSINPDSKP
jgi:putative Mg2+ transporter-C (MgtC) family protein